MGQSVRASAPGLCRAESHRFEHRKLPSSWHFICSLSFTLYCISLPLILYIVFLTDHGSIKSGKIKKNEQFFINTKKKTLTEINWLVSFLVWRCTFFSLQIKATVAVIGLGHGNSCLGSRIAVLVERAVLGNISVDVSFECWLIFITLHTENIIQYFQYQSLRLEACVLLWNDNLLFCVLRSPFVF